jgi:hypothetical protein
MPGPRSTSTRRFYDVASFKDGTNPIRIAGYEREELVM